MKHKFISLLMTLFISSPLVTLPAATAEDPAPAHPPTKTVKHRDIAIVPGWEKVIVENKDLLKNKTGEFGYGMECWTTRGGVIRVIVVDDEYITVRYSIAGHQYEKSCPSGVLYSITKYKFSRMIRVTRRSLRSVLDSL